jgi:hypothetical protein
VINVKIEIPKELPIKQLAQYCDDVVFNIARATLDFTDTEERFPELSGDLRRAAKAEGVVKEGYASYHLGAEDTDYAYYVWKMPQKTHWTNDRTYAQWYLKVYKEKKEIILDKAVSFAKKGQRI